MMAITVPTVDTEISASAFGAPVANALNGFQSYYAYQADTAAGGALGLRDVVTVSIPTVAYATVVDLIFSVSGANDSSVTGFVADAQRLSDGSVIPGLPGRISTAVNGTWAVGTFMAHLSVPANVNASTKSRINFQTGSGGTFYVLGHILAFVRPVL
jgi:hypothetical protein